MFVNLKTRVLSLLLLSAIIIPAHSARQLSFQKAIETGGETSCIAQDKDGVIWLSICLKGLYTYDGLELKKLKIPELGDSTPVIWYIFVDNEGLVWFFIPDYGLYSYNKENNVFNVYRHEQNNLDSISNNNANWLPATIVQDQDGLIWVGTVDGLNSFDKSTNRFTRYKHSPNNSTSISSNDVWSVFVDSKNVVWVGTSNGLNSLNKLTGEFVVYKCDPTDENSISNNFIRTIAEDKTELIWVGTDSGLNSFNKKTKKFTRYKHVPGTPNSLSHNQIHYVMVDQFDNIWILYEANEGISQFNKKTGKFKNYRHKPKSLGGLDSNTLLYIYESHSGILWLANNIGTLNKCIWKEDVFYNYTYAPGQPNNIESTDIAKLYRDSTGGIWIGSYKGGVPKLSNDETFSSIPGLPGTSIHSILEESNGKLWLAIFKGYICLYDAKKGTVTQKFKNPYDITPWYLTKDSSEQNILWFACAYKGGIFSFNTATNKFVAYEYIPGDSSSPSGKPTYSILQDGDDLWLCTGGDGLVKFNKKTKKCKYYKHNPVAKNTISGNIAIEAFIDKEGRLFLDKFRFWDRKV